MTTPNPALAELRAATRTAHADLESSLAVTQLHAGRGEYVDYLCALWGWLAPIEQQLWQAPWPTEIVAEQRSGKRLWIEKDLRAAGLGDCAIRNLPVNAFAPDLNGMPARFGLAYVIEGAQLGTQVLRRRLAPSLGAWSPRWLQGYGEETAGRWQAFIRCAEQCLNTQDARQAAARSAACAFASLASWFNVRGVA